MDRYQFESGQMGLMERSRIPFAIYQFIDKRVVTLVLSAGFCDLFGLPDRAEAYWLMDNDMYRDAHPDDAARIAEAAFKFATKGGVYNVVYRTKAPQESEYTIVHAHGEHVFTADGTRLAVVWYTNEGTFAPGSGSQMSELTEVFSGKLHEESLFRDNLYDHLTGLPNMTHFFDLADAGRASMLRRNDEPALLFFDLCGMKVFNRKYGFAEGDQLIRAVAKLLAKFFGNDNCGRFGQDHFAVFTSAKNLEEILDAIFQECPTVNENRSLPIRVGIYLDKMGQVSVNGACDRAKMACDVNRDSFVSLYKYFDETLMKHAADRAYILENLDRALDEHWIQVYYQPIVRTASGRICDEEALARWRDPVRGLLFPFDFISVLEDARLVYKLDLYMVENILKNMEIKRAAGLTVVPVSINLSRSDFEVCDIVGEICRRVDGARVPHSMITIEITESVIGRDHDYIKSQIDRMHQLGFKVWMDDFGSGYSSLDVLQNFDFDLIKFDMSFMRQLNASEKSGIILTELTRMAMRLGIDTVMEGVETEEQLRFLQSIGCDKIQGFYYSRPVPLDEIIARYKAGLGRGLENPQEADYYTAIGTANINDPSVVTTVADDMFRQFSNSVPMAVMELHGDKVKILRSNEAYRAFIRRTFSHLEDYNGELIPLANTSEAFTTAVRRGETAQDWVKVEEKRVGGHAIHAYLRRISVNPVTGATAMIVYVMTVV